MLRIGDNIGLSVDALRTHKLRLALTVLGITMGVATLITVVTLVQGANVYVETKIATLGKDVFQVSRMPFAVTDFNVMIKAQRNKRFYREDYEALKALCPECAAVGASASMTTKSRAGNAEVSDTSLTGQTASMGDIDTRTIETGRFFSEMEETHGARVCLVGATLRERLFQGADPLGQTVRLANQDFRVIGAYEKMGSVLGQDADNFAVIPLATFLGIRGARTSINMSVKAPGGPRELERAMDRTRLVLRARRHLRPEQEDDFFIGTKDSYIALWQQISGAFFGVFIMVSSISAVVGGIVIMNVMLVSVTERTKEIGIRRAVGAQSADILRQFLTESVMQCLVGGALGIAIGFICALLLRTYTSFPAAVQTQVAVLGLVLSSAIGLFFGIYPATRAARLDPVEALRAD